jgi:hypothetical protein
MRPTRRRSAPIALPCALLVTCLLAAGCRSEEEKARDAFEAEVMATLDNTPEHLEAEVLQTCEKWRRVDKSEACVEEQARQDQFECWLERGYPKLEHGYKYRLRDRTRDHTTLLKQDHCMELRGWKLIHGRRKQYEHLFGAPKKR